MTQPSHYKFSRHRMYSTLPFGLIFSLLIYGGILFIFDRLGAAAVPSWLWWVGLPILIFGLLIQFLCTRVLWIRIYQAATSLFAGLINAVALWLILQTLHYVNIQFAGSIISVLLLLSIWGSYHRTLNQYSSDLLTMPHGRVGTIIKATGIIDTEITPSHVTKLDQASTSKSNYLRNLIPIAIGLVFYVMKTYGPTGNLAIIIFLSSGFAVLCTTITGTLMVYVMAIRKWELQQQTRLYLQ